MNGPPKRLSSGLGAIEQPGRLTAAGNEKGGWVEAVLAHGATIPAIGLGTWQLRGKRCVAAVVEALAAGYRHVDTAAIYDNEAEVGEGIRLSGVPRNRVFLATKVWPDNLRDGALQRSAEDSLKRLGTDDVDLLMIHWPSRRIPLAESIGALNDALQRGLTRFIGVSNFDVALLRDAAKLSAAPLVANQCEYHLNLDQDEIIGACRDCGTAFVSYSPLAKGNLDDPRVTAIADRHRRTGAQVVLRWHLQQGCAAIPKSGDPAHIRENIAVFDFELSPGEMAALSSLRSQSRGG